MKAATVLFALGMVMTSLVGTGPAVTPAGARAILADPAFQTVWDRSDRPLDERLAARSWTWGPEGFYTAYEPYTEGPGGQRLVTYFDKARMEINNPAGDRNSLWFVTNGLLVVDMISGRVQTGNSSFTPAVPANLVVAGDANSPNAPTYASLAGVTSLKGDNRAPNRTGQNIREGLGRDGNVGIVDNLAGYARYGAYESTLGHNIADVFWTFLNQQGVVYDRGQYVQGAVFDWLFAMGYPITEPYWVNVKVNGIDRWVLMQAFQRRILTYSPANPAGWQVEMGNVGRAYFDWRYKGAGVPPAPTPTPRPAASMTISPNSGTVATQVTVTGKNFPANAAVTLTVENAAANYKRTIGTVGSDAAGNWTVKIGLPSDVNVLPAVTIAATANNGAIRTTQKFTIEFTGSPKIYVSPVGAVQAFSWLQVEVQGFPPNTDVRLGYYFPATRQMLWLKDVETDSKGVARTTLALGDRAAGTQLSVIALVDNYKASSERITVTAAPPPDLVITPNGLAVGQVATISGVRWPVNAPISLGLARENQAVEEWLTPTRTDENGSFTASFMLGERWRNAGQIRLVATVTGGAPYKIIPFWVVSGGGRVIPSGLPMTVTTYWYKNGPTFIKATATGWAAGKRINLSVISGDGLVNVPIGTVTVRGDGTFDLKVEPSGPWWGRRDLGVRAVATDNSQASVRYLPTTSMAKVSGNAYNAAGYNWPSNTRIEVVAHINGQPERVIGTVTTNADGVFSVNVGMPRFPEDNKNDIEIRATNQPYVAFFDF